MVQVTLPDPVGPNAPADNGQRWTKNVVIYDGDCRFCTAQVERLQRYDSEGKLAFISLHDPRIQERFPELTYEDMMRQMYVVAPDGRKYGGASAVRYLSRRLPKLYWLMPIMHIPFSLPVWQWLYGQVAKRRYKLSGKTCDGDSCAVHFKK